MRALTINPGQRFSMLTVVAETGARPRSFRMACDCGNEAVVRLTHLRTGHTRSCGHLHFRGEAPAYRTVHLWIRKHRGKPDAHPCVDCAGTATEWSYNNSDPDALTSSNGFPYSLDLQRYEPRCRPCHRSYDINREGNLGRGWRIKRDDLDAYMESNVPATQQRRSTLERGVA